MSLFCILLLVIHMLAVADRLHLGWGRERATFVAIAYL